METQTFKRTICHLCDGPLEYPAEMENQVIPCPHCGESIWLVDAGNGGGFVRAAVEAGASPGAALPCTTEPDSLRPDAPPWPTSLDIRSRFRRIPLNAVVGVAVALAITTGLAALWFLREGQETQPSQAAGVVSGDGLKGIRARAEAGDWGAQRKLGLCYARGVGVPRDDKEAVRWWRKAAEQGDARAQSKMGACYATGQGVPRNPAEAARWFLKAAEGGDAFAQSCLGGCYYDGSGVPKDYGEAVKWWRKAAEQGLARAQDSLGRAYADGKGVSKNLDEAIKWLAKAAAQGDEAAKKNLASATAEQREEAERERRQAQLQAQQRAVEQAQRQVQQRAAEQARRVAQWQAQQKAQQHAAAEKEIRDAYESLLRLPASGTFPVADLPYLVAAVRVLLERETRLNGMSDLAVNMRDVLRWSEAEIAVEARRDAIMPPRAAEWGQRQTQFTLEKIRREQDQLRRQLDQMRMDRQFQDLIRGSLRR